MSPRGPRVGRRTPDVGRRTGDRARTSPPFSRARGLPAVFAAALLVAGCSSDLLGVRLLVRTDMQAGVDCDGFVVTVVGFADDSGTPMCTPASLSLPRVPYTILVEPGATYGASVAFRVAAVNGAGVPIAWTDTPMIPWPEEGVVDVVVDLPAACIPLACDAAVAHCAGGGSCERLPLGLVFDRACVAGVDCGGDECLDD